MLYRKPKIRLMGDRALLVELGDGISPRINQKVCALYTGLAAQCIEGIKDLVPSYRSLMVVYDPLVIALDSLQSQLNETWSTLDDDRLAEPRTVEIPVVYGEQYGPDLEWVADYHKMSLQEVIRLHTQPLYQVYMIGFMPGYPYMGEVPDEIVTPRRKTPRTLVPAGSIGIAQKQTGIYPVASPGGWQIIGRTPVRLFDPQAQPPCFLEMGDRIKFLVITEQELLEWRP
jgi:KipI family sensor histidine kinase inhibitor